MANATTGSIEEAMTEAEALCVVRGERLTPPRRRVLQLVLQADEPLTAYEVLSRLKGDGARAAQPPTAYRALEFLARMGLVHRLESLRAYVACRHSHDDHAAVFMVCRECGQAREARADSTAALLKGIAEAAGYIPAHVIQEVHGRCAECAATA